MTPERYNGLTYNEAEKRLCAELEKRTGVPYEVILDGCGNVCKILVDGEWDDEVEPFLKSHDTLQRLLDVLTPEELRKMHGELLRIYRATHKEYIVDYYIEWLIKRDLLAFVQAVLVAIEGEE